MDKYQNLIRPKALQPGNQYIYRVRETSENKPSNVNVVFIDDTPCPAIVIVGDGNGKTWRCSRDELFIQQDGHIKP